MRLGQTSRTLNIASHKIVELISEQFREIKDHPNVKLTDEEFDFVQNYFAPKEEKEALIEVVSSIETIPEEETASTGDVEAVHEFIEDLRPKKIRLEDEFNEQKEGLVRFKAEKVALEGLTVLGKIELPEPKPKEIKEEAETEERPVKKKFERRSDRKRSSRRNGKNSLTPAEERAKAERIAYRKKVEDEKRQKALKKKHYEQNVKAKIHAQKPKKKKKSFEVKAENLSAQSKQTPKKDIHKATGLKRLWLWLNGAYDKNG